MQHNKRLILVLTLIMAVVVLAACGSAPEAEEKEAPYTLEPIDGTDLNKVILTEKAAERLGIETATVENSTVPYSAIVYDVNGGTWVYIMTDELSYQRASVTIDNIEGGEATITDGLDSGDEVVTVGVAELYGADTGVGK